MSETKISLKENLRISVLSWVGQIVLEMVLRTNRWIVHGEDHLRNSRTSGRPTLLLTWHGRLSYCSFFLHRANLPSWTVASRHGDGAIMAKIVERWGFGLMRGSSRKGGREVLVKMNQVFKSEDNFVGLTSDGPKGPVHVAKPGSAALARKHHADIIAITGTSTRYWEAKSWDKFRIPKPFGTIQITIAAPLKYPKGDLSPDEESQLISEYLNRNHERGEHISREAR